MNFLVVFLGVLIFVTGIVTVSYSEEFVPSWIKNIAKWYGDGLISDQEYLNSIKFLIENNIITITGVKEKTTTVEPKILTPEKSFTDPRIVTCDILYQSYLLQDRSEFQQEHLHITYIRDCMNLYEDKVWHYQGTDRLERIYNKFIEIHKQKSEFPQKTPLQPHVDIRSIINIGNEKSMIRFNVCAGDKLMDKAKVLVKSDIEIVLVGSDKDIQKNSCRGYETQIYAKHPKNIEIEIIEKVLAETK